MKHRKMPQFLEIPYCPLTGARIETSGSWGSPSGGPIAPSRGHELKRIRGGRGRRTPDCPLTGARIETQQTKACDHIFAYCPLMGVRIEPWTMRLWMYISLQIAPLRGRQIYSFSRKKFPMAGTTDMEEAFSPVFCPISICQNVKNAKPKAAKTAGQDSRRFDFDSGLLENIADAGLFAC